jgi:hypothetical protein
VSVSQPSNANSSSPATPATATLTSTAIPCRRLRGSRRLAVNTIPLVLVPKSPTIVTSVATSTASA